MKILGKELEFPDPSTADSHGLLAIGGDLSTDRLLLAYRSGIFPWYSDGDPICWWSPDPRMVFDLKAQNPIKVSKSLKQSRRNRNYIIKQNTCFEEVMRSCMDVKRGLHDGTWINEDMIAAYTDLHRIGVAKSIEVFHENKLVGGLYGIDLKDKGIFCGESMFSHKTDASKIALWHLVEKLQHQGYRCIDAQLYNDHLSSLGAVEIDREVFLSYL
ncbi:leucyl/phenylalanyl-tRNA--protein transferase [Nonlabens sp. Hel1_33_55]|uniref:leucyl/phenylalanyl-tRNA--protein transferase n=1 Tax=Nonlabens sp. Hel1_33_55 TaxID=1336802 RepID=UPI000875E112|nr:leucyl/phenylalanyl-tRNA--protein transferase [Nonlabens sp. Hel1_33_55]SCY37180.1 leucyl/phenylalanyl-tRNA--protein transferase [Nonlabens sp. Hel1_33_55]